MKKCNALKTIIIVVVITFITVLLLLSSPWLVLMIGGQLSPNPPKPEITYGEFPFRLEYEINDETIIINDTLICEFDGFVVNEARGKYRKWKSYLASGKERITLLSTEDYEIFFSPGLNNWEIAAIYMGDNEIYHGSTNSTFPNAWETKEFKSVKMSAYIISAEEMWEKYRLKLIRWEPSPPIQNSFK